MGEKMAELSDELCKKITDDNTFLEELINLVEEPDNHSRIFFATEGRPFPTLSLKFENALSKKIEKYPITFIINEDYMGQNPKYKTKPLNPNVEIIQVAHDLLTPIYAKHWNEFVMAENSFIYLAPHAPSKQFHGYKGLVCNNKKICNKVYENCTGWYEQLKKDKTSPAPNFMYTVNKHIYSRFNKKIPNQYKNKWVAIGDGRILSCDENREKALDTARQESLMYQKYLFYAGPNAIKSDYK